jgi:hypothetical protein
MKSPAAPRGGLSVMALAIVLFVPLAVGWTVEQLAYGDARATESVVAPLRATEPRPAAAVRLAGVQAAPATVEAEPKTVVAENVPEYPKR